MVLLPGSHRCENVNVPLTTAPPAVAACQVTVNSPGSPGLVSVAVSLVLSGLAVNAEVCKVCGGGNAFPVALCVALNRTEMVLRVGSTAVLKVSTIAEGCAVSMALLAGDDAINLGGAGSG